MLNDEDEPQAAHLPHRGSWRARSAAHASSLTLRQISSVLPPDQAWGLWASRQIVARIMDTFGPSLSGAKAVRVDTATSDGRRIVGEWVWGSGVSRDGGTPAVYFVHGSGYALCSPRTHRRLTAWLSQLTGLPVFSIDYRLAPRHRFPTAADDVRHPAALVLMSPLVDLTFGLARTRELDRPDPAIRSRDAARLVELYCTGVASGHPRLRLDVAGGRRLPPTLIQAGGAEMLAADAIALADDLRTTGTPCDLQIWPDQVHVFQALPRLTPEAAPAMRRIAAFIEQSLRENDIGQVG